MRLLCCLSISSRIINQYQFLRHKLVIAIQEANFRSIKSFFYEFANIFDSEESLLQPLFQLSFRKQIIREIPV
jgi:hypothetical protein